MKRQNSVRLDPDWQPWGPMDVTGYYNEIYLDLFRNNQNTEKERLKAKLDYYKKYCMSDKVHLRGVPLSTSHDGDNAFYKGIIRKYVG